jgi:putative sterol carrier protein
LRQLQDAGIARRRALPPPAPATVYELTSLGEGLRPVMLSLMNWGVHLLGAPKAGESFNPTWLMQTMQDIADREAALGVRETYEFCVNGAVFHVRVDDGDVEAAAGPAENPAFITRTDLDTFLAMGSGELDVAEAVRDERVEFEGDAEAAQRAAAILSSQRLTQMRHPEQVDPAAPVAA